MKVQGNSKPIFEFTVINYDGTADLIFRENIEDISPEDTPNSLFSWNEYHLSRPWYTNIYDDILSNYETWFNAAKLEDEKRNKVDIYQLKADVDFLQITQQLLSGISTISEESNSDILDKCWEYYPNRWDKNKISLLKNANLITEEDYIKIVGQD